MVAALVLAVAPLDGAFAKGDAKQARPAAQKVVKAKKKPAVKKQAVAPKRSAKKQVAKKRPAARKQVVAKRKQSTSRARAVARRAAPVMAPLQLVDGKPLLKSTVAYVIDQETGEVLLGKNDDAVRPIASLTKLMTGIVIAEAGLPMNERIVITSDDVDRLKFSSSRLKVGTELTRRQALHLALMSSENRAAHALARTYPGGESAFVSAMNNMAQKLGMDQTRYVEPTGLSSENQSSARDLAILAAAAYDRPLLRQYSTSPGYQLGSLRYVNTNRLVRAGDWRIGVQKTGYISEAGQCLLMQAGVAGRKLIMVFLDATSPVARIRDAETVKRWIATLPDDAGRPQAAATAGPQG